MKTIKHASTSIVEATERIEVTKGWDKHDKNLFELKMVNDPAFIPHFEEELEKWNLYDPVLWAYFGKRLSTKFTRVAIIAFPNENNTQLAARLRRLTVPPRGERLRVSRPAVSYQRDHWRKLAFKGPRARRAMRYVWAGRTLGNKCSATIIARPDLNDSQLGRLLGVSRERITQQRHKMPPNLCAIAS